MKKFMNKTIVLLLTGLLLVHTTGANYTNTKNISNGSQVETSSSKNQIGTNAAGDNVLDHTYY